MKLGHGLGLSQHFSLGIKRRNGPVVLTGHHVALVRGRHESIDRERQTGQDSEGDSGGHHDGRANATHQLLNSERLAGRSRIDGRIE